MQAIVEYLFPLLWGVVTTVLVAIASITGCAVVSAIFGVALQCKTAGLGLAVRILIELLCGASVLIYLFWIFYALPLVPGAPQFSPLVASILVLSVIGGAYGAEIVSGGLRAVPPGQTEGARALGLSPLVILLRVTLPQALARVLPAFASLAVDMVKWTLIVSFVGVPDLLYTANAIRAVSYQTIPIYLALALIYWGLCTMTGLIFQALEYALPTSKARRAQGLPAARRPTAGRPLRGRHDLGLGLRSRHSSRFAMGLCRHNFGNGRLFVARIIRRPAPGHHAKRVGTPVASSFAAPSIFSAACQF